MQFRQTSISILCLFIGQLLVPSSRLDAQACKKVTAERFYREADVYASSPYKQGEVSEYKVYYGLIYVGNGHVKVNPPFKFKNNWRQVFDAEGKTGSWYSFVFSGHDRMRVISSADRGLALWAYVDQNEQPIGAKPYIKQKTMMFDPIECKVETKSFRDNDKSKLKTKVNSYDPSASDTLSAVFTMRNKRDFKMDQTITFPVFSSGKSWNLEATPVGYEKVYVKGLGHQRCLKLKIQTYIGSHLQQKGSMFAWISEDHPSRPLVKATGDLRIGKISVELTKFKAGK